MSLLKKFFVGNPPPPSGKHASGQKASNPASASPEVDDYGFEVFTFTKNGRELSSKSYSPYFVLWGISAGDHLERPGFVRIIVQDYEEKVDIKNWKLIEVPEERLKARALEEAKTIESVVDSLSTKLQSLVAQVERLRENK